MERPDDLLEEPLFIGGSFVRRWTDLARLPRPDDARDGGPRQLRHRALPHPRVPEVPDEDLTSAVD